MKLNKKYIKFSLINAFIALILFFFLQKVYFLPGDDSKAFFYGPILKHKIFGTSEKALDYKKYLLVNTHYDNMIVENYDKHNFPKGNVVITDRVKLIAFFKNIHELNSHKYLVCDILFENKSIYDDTLSSTIKRAKNIIIPRKKELNTTLPQFRDINSGLVDIYTTRGLFYKYTLEDYFSKLKSIPLKMYEDIHKTKNKSYYVFSWLNKNLVFNDFVPEYKISSYNTIAKNDVPIINLGDLVSLSKKNLEDYTKNKIIILGNYNSDMKGTIYGNMAGPLILLNSYLSIENKDNTIKFTLVVFLFFVFFIFSYVAKSSQEKIENKILNIPFLGTTLLGTSYIIIMLLISLIIYFIFGNSINLTYLALLFFIQNLWFNRNFYIEKLKKKVL